MVYHYGGGRVQSGVWLIAEEILGVKRYGSCNTHPLLHTSTKFGGHLFVGIYQINPFKAEIGALQHLLPAPIGEELHRKDYILLHCGKVKERTPLEEHTYLSANSLLLLNIQSVEERIAIPYLTRIGSMKPNQRLKEHSLA